MKYGLTKTLAAIAGFCLIFGLLATVICTISVSRTFYYKEYDKLGVAEDIGISAQDLREATDVLLSYTEGKRDDMLIYAEIKGERAPVFNQRETDHMVDVRELFINAKKVGFICLIAGAAVLIALFFAAKDKRAVFSGYLLGNWIFLGAVAVIVIYAALDFNSFWTNFHHVFFTKNDFWILDPRTDNLILMVPEQFFSDLVFRIVAVFLAVAAALAVFSGVMSSVFKKRKKKEA